MTEAAPNVVVAGATGFVGRALGKALAGRYVLTGLSRSDRPGADGFAAFRRCDLFSREDAERALAGADLAVYLVHSMMPSARLTQGSFEDLDLICADNFARAAARAGVRQIVYLGGLVPAGQDGLSAHLRSRLEVEAALRARGVPVTVLRAGLVLGAGGSSTQLLVRLVERLPFMACPAWTQTKTQPVALDDVTASVAQVLGDVAHFDRTYDLGAPERLTYLELMRETARATGVRRRFLELPFFSPGFSRLWISLVTGAPRSLVAPLIESLAHEMVARPDARAPLADRCSTPVSIALARAVEATERSATPHAYRGARDLPPESLARSVQRMQLPAGRDAAWASAEYLRWLPGASLGLIRVQVEGERARFVLRPTGIVLLELRRESGDSPDLRQFTVSGGVLAGRVPRGRLEFRTVHDRRTLLCAVHDFEPRLPWWLYRSSQALFHAAVMALFRRHLSRAPAGELAAPA